MPKQSLSTIATLAFLTTFVVSVYCSSPMSGLGRLVGGRTKIRDIESNREVQELGRYSVVEYNRQQHSSNGSELTFTSVVEAEKQVVSGIKYYMKVKAAAATQSGQPRSFNAVVLVKPWTQSKQLLNFAPSPSNIYNNS